MNYKLLHLIFIAILCSLTSSLKASTIQVPVLSCDSDTLVFQDHDGAFETTFCLKLAFNPAGEPPTKSWGALFKGETNFVALQNIYTGSIFFARTDAWGNFTIATDPSIKALGFYIYQPAKKSFEQPLILKRLFAEPEFMPAPTYPTMQPFYQAYSEQFLPPIVQAPQPLHYAQHAPFLAPVMQTNLAYPHYDSRALPLHPKASSAKHPAPLAKTVHQLNAKVASLTQHVQMLSQQLIRTQYEQPQDAAQSTDTEKQGLAAEVARLSKALLEMQANVSKPSNVTPPQIEPLSLLEAATHTTPAANALEPKLIVAAGIPIQPAVIEPIITIAPKTLNPELAPAANVLESKLTVAGSIITHPTIIAPIVTATSVPIKPSMSNPLATSAAKTLNPELVTATSIAATSAPIKQSISNPIQSKFPISATQVPLFSKQDFPPLAASLPRPHNAQQQALPALMPTTHKDLPSGHLAAAAPEKIQPKINMPSGQHLIREQHISNAPELFTPECSEPEQHAKPKKSKVGTAEKKRAQKARRAELFNFSPEFSAPKKSPAELSAEREALLEHLEQKATEIKPAAKAVSVMPKAALIKEKITLEKLALDKQTDQPQDAFASLDVSQRILIEYTHIFEHYLKNKDWSNAIAALKDLDERVKTSSCSKKNLFEFEKTHVVRMVYISCNAPLFLTSEDQEKTLLRVKRLLSQPKSLPSEMLGLFYQFLAEQEPINKEDHLYSGMLNNNTLCACRYFAFKIAQNQKCSSRNCHHQKAFRMLENEHIFNVIKQQPETYFLALDLFFNTSECPFLEEEFSTMKDCADHISRYLKKAREHLTNPDDIARLEKRSREKPFGDPDTIELLKSALQQYNATPQSDAKQTILTDVLFPLINLDTIAPLTDLLEPLALDKKNVSDSDFTHLTSSISRYFSDIFQSKEPATTKVVQQSLAFYTAQRSQDSDKALQIALDEVFEQQQQPDALVIRQLSNAYIKYEHRSRVLIEKLSLAQESTALDVVTFTLLVSDILKELTAHSLITDENGLHPKAILNAIKIRQVSFYPLIQKLFQLPNIDPLVVGKILGKISLSVLDTSFIFVEALKASVRMKDYDKREKYQICLQIMAFNMLQTMEIKLNPLINDQPDCLSILQYIYPHRVLLLKKYPIVSKGCLDKRGDFVPQEKLKTFYFDPLNIHYQPL